MLRAPHAKRRMRRLAVVVVNPRARLAEHLSGSQLVDIHQPFAS